MPPSARQMKTSTGSLAAAMNKASLYKVSSILMPPSTNGTIDSTGPRVAVHIVAGTTDLHIHGNIVIASISLQPKTNGSQITR